MLPRKKKFDAVAPSRIQVNTLPFRHEVDFSPLEAIEYDPTQLDGVSVADLLRNTFVYPPHSIYRNVKVVASGFDPAKDMYADPEFSPPFPPTPSRPRPPSGTVDDEVLLDTYHRLLCDAITHSTDGMRSPWLLQSGGKDSTSMAIALADARPDAHCVTYLGGSEENEVESASLVARKLGLDHETLVCDPARAYDRYLAMLPRMPLLTADFVVLGYADLATEVAINQGDGIIDALGADQYFGAPMHAREYFLAALAQGVRVPQWVFRSRLVRRNFHLCYALATLQMQRFERYFPGSRFSDAEVDALLGWNASACSRQRMQIFQPAIEAAGSSEGARRIAFIVDESADMAKGMYVSEATSLRLAYPYCDEQLGDWVFQQVPDDRLVGRGGLNKLLMRRHIARHFRNLPYVKTKGSFRFDLRGLASRRFDQVYAFAEQARALLPGAPRWLQMHRKLLDNKYFASKFYLLAVTLPWLLSRMHAHATVPDIATERTP